MNLAEAPVRLFHRALMVWVLLFTFFSWAGFDAVNVLERSPQWLPPGPLKHITHTLPQLPDAWQATLLLILPWAIIGLAAMELWQPARWWRLALIWWLCVNVMNTGWLSGSGGQQLMANVLFWSIFLPLRRNDDEPRTMAVAAFWIIRLQVLLAYAATGLHKLTGTHWLDGTALGIVATDPAFGPAWIAAHPTAAKLLTWLILFFQLSFPIAIWFRSVRLPWMLFGVVFHLGTAIWMDIPEMGLAFIVCYTLWLDAGDLRRLGLQRRSAEDPAPRSTQLATAQP